MAKADNLSLRRQKKVSNQWDKIEMFDDYLIVVQRLKLLLKTT